MRTAILLSLLALAPAAARAEVTCWITMPSDPAHPYRYDKTIFQTDLAESVGPQTTLFAFVKEDRSVVKMERDEFYATKDLSAIDGAVYFSLQHAAEQDYLIGYGHVDASNKEEPLQITAFMTGGIGPQGFSLSTWKERLIARCNLKK